MAFFIGRDREARRAYGFDEIALVPGDTTYDPDEVDISTKLGPFSLQIPFIASAMDGVTDPRFAVTMGKFGGLAVLNLDGIYTRYKEPQKVLAEIASADAKTSTNIVQDLYREPIKSDLIAERIHAIKKAKVACAVSTIPANAEKYGKIAQEAGADVFFIQATIVTTRHNSTKIKPVDLHKFIASMKIPVVVGNCVTYSGALDLIETGAAGILVGVGPGSACTTRGVLGLGVPQVTAIVDCAAARDFYFKRSGKYVSLIADGGMATGGDVCKAFACGADGVMMGSPFAKSSEAPGRGYHWGMATPHANLPRGTRVHVGITGSLEEILFGPSRTDDGTQNLVGALRTCMASVGARNIREMQLAEIVIAPSIKTEGKLLQRAQAIGMGK